MKKFSSTFRPALLLLLFGSALLWSACGGPSIESTSIDGRVRQIDNWAIEWVGDSTVMLDSVALRWLTESRSKYTEPDFCLAYASDVRSRLVSEHGLPFYENQPVTGRIELAVRGAKRTLAAYASTTDAQRITAELAEDRPATLADPFDRDAIYRYTVDHVQQVSVKIYDRDRTLLGEVFVGGEDGDKVKPEQVAKAIANAITQGRAKALEE